MLIFLFIIGCNINDEKPEKKQTDFPMNLHYLNLEQKKVSILNSGDIDAYESVSAAYLDYASNEEFLIYALTMANKYEYPQAYFDVYICLTDVYLTDITKMDKRTSDMSIEYLILASKKGHQQAKEIVEKYEIEYSKNNILQLEKIFK